MTNSTDHSKAHSTTQSKTLSLAIDLLTRRSNTPEDAGCQELIADGDFEHGAGAWTMTGALVDTTRAYSGSAAAHFPGGPASYGVMTQTLLLPPYPQAGTLWFAFRIENQDYGP